MIDFYFHGGPNPMKVALMLEETALDYRAIPTDIFKGDQHAPAFAALNPNEKVPVIVDDVAANALKASVRLKSEVDVVK